jgi:hypothetical protein
MAELKRPATTSHNCDRKIAEVLEQYRDTQGWRAGDVVDVHIRHEPGCDHARGGFCNCDATVSLSATRRLT